MGSTPTLTTPSTTGRSAAPKGRLARACSCEHRGPEGRERPVQVSGCGFDSHPDDSLQEPWSSGTDARLSLGRRGFDSRWLRQTNRLDTVLGKRTRLRTAACVPWARSVPAPRSSPCSGGQAAKPPGSQPGSSVAVGPSGQPGWSVPDRPLVPGFESRSEYSRSGGQAAKPSGFQPGNPGFESRSEYFLLLLVRLPDSRRRDLVASQASFPALRVRPPPAPLGDGPIGRSAAPEGRVARARLVRKSRPVGARTPGKAERLLARRAS